MRRIAKSIAYVTSHIKTNKRVLVFQVLFSGKVNLKRNLAIKKKGETVKF